MKEERCILLTMVPALALDSAAHRYPKTLKLLKRWSSLDEGDEGSY